MSRQITIELSTVDALNAAATTVRGIEDIVSRYRDEEIPAHSCDTIERMLSCVADSLTTISGKIWPEPEEVRS